MKKTISIIRYDTQEIVRKIDVSGKSQQQIDKIENGMNINLNHMEYYIQQEQSNE